MIIIIFLHNFFCVYYFFFYAQFFHEWWVVKIIFHILILLLFNSFFNFDISYSFNTSMAKWLIVRLRSKWLGVRIPLLSLKLQIFRLHRARSSLICRQTMEYGFTLKLVRDVIITYSQDLFTQLRPSGIIWDKISLHFIRIKFLNVGTVWIFLSLLFVAVVSFYFGIKQLQCKTNTIPVYICYSWFNSWLLLFLILYSCYLLFLLVILVILIFDPYTRVYLLFLLWCGYIFPSINKPDIDITTIY